MASLDRMMATSYVLWAVKSNHVSICSGLAAM